jgi:hypothetical protein
MEDEDLGNEVSCGENCEEKVDDSDVEPIDGILSVLPLSS